MSGVIEEALAKHPRVRLAHLPTPLEAMENLSKKLGGPSLYIKRDDCTGVAMGGNKARQAEFYFGKAVAEGADTIVTTGAFQSNHVRMSCAYARKLGMECEIQLEHRVAGGGDTYLNSGNVLLDRMFGARIHEYPDGEDEAGADRNLGKIADSVRAAGGKPYVIPLAAGHPPTGALGYVEAAAELMNQAAAMGIDIGTVVLPSGSASTHAGMLAGLRALGSTVRVLGVCVRRNAEAQGPRVLKRTRETMALAGLPVEITEADVQVTDGYFGDGYGQLTESAREAMTLAAECEGLLLDPVYTAKAMAGLIGAVRDGTIAQDETAVFLHTGGTPALFAYEEFLEAR